MDAKQSFKAGFLLRCAEEGLDRDQIIARIHQVKQAFDMGTIPRLSLGTAIGAGVLGGAAIGGAAGLVGRDDILARKRPANLQSLQQAELAATYLQQANEIRRQKQLIERRQQRLESTPVTSRYGI